PDFECPALDEEGMPPLPRCGCDGVTYLSECHRLQAGVALEGPLECP
ncbi:MAG: hypothetical protein KDK70_07995, partial [Myxococcales bacterium]|nr:hypothetical protein [Myxococcales bacterium]